MLAGFAAVTALVAYAGAADPVGVGADRSAGAGQVTDPEYWVRHVREPVRFADAVAALRAAGARTFVEIGPDAVLAALGGQVAGAAVRTVRCGCQCCAGAGTSRGRWWRRWPGSHVRGVPVDWAGFYAGSGARRGRPADLCVPAAAVLAERGGRARRMRRVWGWRRRVIRCWARRWTCRPAGGLVLTGRLSLAAQPWLAASTREVTGAGRWRRWRCGRRMRRAAGGWRSWSSRFR